MRVARHVGQVPTLILLLVALSAGHVVFLVLRSPSEADGRATMAALIPLFLMPSAIAMVGLVRASMPVVGAAGALCILPAIMTGIAVIPFAGFLAIAGLTRGPLPSGRELLRGIAVAILGTAAWFVPYVGMATFASIDGPRQAVAFAMVLATIGLAIGPAAPRVVGQTRLTVGRSATDRSSISTEDSS